MQSSDITGARHRRGRSKGAIAVGVVAAAMMTASLVVYQASSAAFTTSTENHGDTFVTGALALSDNDGGSTALFTVGNLLPGDSGSSCITVSYTGTAIPSAPVQLYVAAGDGTDTPGSGGGGVTPAINWSVETAAGSGVLGNGAACTGLSGTSTIWGNTADTAITAGHMLSDFIGKNAYSSGGTTSVSSAWTPTTGTTTKVFRLNYKLATDAPNSAMGASVGLKITWEAHS
jgi:hypothetical protein